MTLLVRVVASVWIALNVYHALADDGALAARWHALQVNCSVSPTRLSEVSESAAAVVFDELALDRAQQAEWLHALGDWHLLHGGNLSRAEEFLRASADMGHSTAQFLVGAFAATSETPSPAESAVFYQFASRAGSVHATIALAYRHLVGYHAPKSCEVALRLYKTVADDVIRHGHALPNRALPVQVFSIPAPVLLTDDQDKQPHTDDDERDRVEYLRQRCATSSNAALLVRTASLVLFSDLYQEGTKLHRDAQRQAVGLLERAAVLGSTSAKALLGHVYAYGLAGVRVDMEAAIHHYETAINSSIPDQIDDNGHAEAANGLGMLYLRGVDGISSNVEKAMAYFKVAARHGHAEGVFHAADVMAHADPHKSIEYLEASAEVGHVGAIFRLARVKEKQRFRMHESGCEAIVKTYKLVAEHHQFGRELLKRAAEAFLRGQYEHSLRLYRLAGELGYEVAEQNALWLLERYVFSSPIDAVAAATYHQLINRGVAQKNVDAEVRAGDVEYFKGNYRAAMKHYLRAIHWNPSHARALFSVGFMCQWGLGTIHNGRSLERARWYYTQAQEHEPLLAYVLPLLVLPIDVEHIIGHYTVLVTRFVDQAVQKISSWFTATYSPGDKTGELIFDSMTITSDAPVHFVSAMGFNGESSSVTVETTTPSTMDGMTLEMSLWIEKPSRFGNRDEATVQVLLEWSNTIRVELVPHSDGICWQIRVLGSSSFESVLTLTKFALRARHWYHIALVVDVPSAKVRLVVDSQVQDSGNLLMSIPLRPSRSLILVGHPQPGTRGATTAFHGKITQYRIWSSALDEHQRSRQSNGLDQTPPALWIDLFIDEQKNSHPQESETDRISDRQQHHNSEVTALDIDLRMVRLPLPPN